MMWNALIHAYVFTAVLLAAGSSAFSGMCRLSADPRDEVLDMSDRRVRQHPMAQIEYERPARKRLQNGIDRAIERRAADQQRQRIEITLDRPLRLDAVPHEGK